MKILLPCHADDCVTHTVSKGVPACGSSTMVNLYIKQGGICSQYDPRPKLSARANRCWVRQKVKGTSPAKWHKNHTGE